MSGTQTTPLSREEAARGEAGGADVSRATAWVLVGAFLGLLYLVPLAQAALDLRAHRAVGGLQLLEPLREARGAWAAGAGAALGPRLLRANHALQQGLHAYEAALKDASFLHHALVPPVQQIMTGALGVGNEKACLGTRERGQRWLFYRPDVESVTGPGLLDAAVLRKRERAGDAWRPAPHPDPRPAILDFRDQLSSRGIALILMPTPVKPTIDPARLAPGVAPAALPRNPSFAALLADLRAAGVAVYDPAESILAGDTNAGSPYLATDTHWRPEAIERAASGLADAVLPYLPPANAGARPFREVTETVSNRGDIARMLRLPAGSRLFADETVTIRPVLVGPDAYWRPTAGADVLLLGDSFANIYSQGFMGWGRSAGLPERLSLHLGQPLDTLVRNDAGASATREWLAQELAQGRDRLAGKKVVVWQFAERELAQGDWKILPLTLGQRHEGRFYVPAGGETVEVTGEVESVAAVPRPGSAVYPDHIVSVHVIHLTGAHTPLPAGAEAVVELWSMRGNRPMPAASLYAGQAVRLRLRPWEDVQAEYGGIRRSELDDDALALAEPCWGEIPE